VIARVLATIRRVPPAGRACFLIAFASAAIWTIMIPPFQVPDEVVHFAYAQYLAETGKPPPQGLAPQYSPQEYAALAGLLTTTVIGRADTRGVVSAADDRALRAALATKPSPTGPGGASPATNQPPLYYALEAIPYWLSPSSDILARLEFMRLLSALFGAATVLCVYLFLRELVRDRPWMWTVGALVVAFQPQFMFITAGVHVDSLLFLASAATFLGLIRAWRRGLTVGRAATIGGVTAVGLLTKLTFVAFLPGIALAVAVLAWRALPGGRRQTLRALAAAVATAAGPVAAYALLDAAAWHRGTTASGFASVTAAAGGHAVSINESLDYIWQLYLPVLPFMNHVYFAAGYPLWDVWLNGLIGHFGWLDYGFPAWVYSDGRWLLYLLVVLVVAACVRLPRERVRAVLPIFAAFLVMAIGLLAAIGWEGIRYRLQTGFAFEQARYLFPLLPLYGLFVALAASGAPRRWGPALGAALVLLAMAHGLFAETLTISRYYG
jgi:4-amino-4-deoxy-L-arabinose transferase-like glycosyltransferase